ncbi:MAG: DUF2330 domain-containing protein [Thermoplasmata archaeon]
MRKIISMCIILSILLLSVLTISGGGKADGGMIPYQDIDVSEPGQNAIIAWNGQKEKMILSVDAYSQSDTPAVHIVPFPSEPSMEKGNLSSFEEVEELINEKGIEGGLPTGGSSGDSSGVTIIKHEIIGLHDLTTIKVDSWGDFSDWFNDFLEEKGVEEVVFPEKTDSVVKNYLERDITYFALDIVDLSTDVKSIDPIIYTFKTDELYYPLEISSIMEGETSISLSLITPISMVLDCKALNDYGFQFRKSTNITQEDVARIEESFEKIIESEAHLSYFEGTFELENLERDVGLGHIENIAWNRIGIIDNSYYYFLHYNSLGFQNWFSKKYQSYPEYFLFYPNPHYSYGEQEDYYFISMNTGEIEFTWKPEIDGLQDFRISYPHNFEDEGKTRIMIKGDAEITYESEGKTEWDRIDYYCIINTEGETLWSSDDDDPRYVEIIGTPDGKRVAVSDIKSQGMDDYKTNLKIIDYETNSIIFNKSIMGYRKITFLDDKFIFMEDGEIKCYSVDNWKEIYSIDTPFLDENEPIGTLGYADIDGDYKDEILFGKKESKFNYSVYTIDLEDRKIEVLIKDLNGYTDILGIVDNILVYDIAYYKYDDYDNKTLVGYDINKGKDAWKIDHYNDQIYFVFRDEIISTDFESNLTYIDIKNGKTEWAKNFDDYSSTSKGYSDVFMISPYGEKFKGYDGCIEVIDGNNLYLLEPDNGDVIWEFHTDSTIALAWPDSEGDDIYIQTYDRIIVLEGEEVEASHSSNEDDESITNVMVIGVAIIVVVLIILISFIVMRKR